MDGSRSRRCPHQQVADTLAAGIQDITNAMVEDFKLTDVLRMILETMFRALEFDRIIFCMRDAKTEMMTGRFGLGRAWSPTSKVSRSPSRPPRPICLQWSASRALTP